MEPLTREYTTKIAKPIADSAAATVKINKAKIWPIKSSKYTEHRTKFRLTASNINSKDISIMIIFFLFKKIPHTPIKNRIKLTVKYLKASIGIS